jgi:diguanylate cyclase (GGDEF)-like protein/PAS domain S-box-containing protein
MKASNYQTLLESMYEGVYYVDLDRKIKYWSKGAEIITGYSCVEALGRQCSRNFLAHTSLNGVDYCTSDCLMRNTLISGSYLKTEAYLIHKNGKKVHVSLRISPMFDNKGKISGATHIFTNNEAYLNLRPDEIKRNYELYYDPLTDLPTRYNTELTLKTKIEEFRRYQWQFAIYLMEIDDFEELKKTYDKEVVDSFIMKFSKLIRKDIRPFDILGRWDENKFLVIMVNVHEKEMRMLGERMRQLIEKTAFKTENTSQRITFSQGSVLISKEITSEKLIEKLEELLRKSVDASGNKATYKVY